MSAIDVIAEQLTALGLRFRTSGDDLVVVAFTGDNIHYEAVIQPRDRIVSVVAHTVAMIPRPRLEETIRVANLLNATRVTFGCFWVDPIRSRVSFELTLAAPDGPTLGQVGLAMAALSQIDDCFPAIAAVIWGDRTAEAALFPAGAVEPGDEPPALDLAV